MEGQVCVRQIRRGNNVTGRTVTVVRLAVAIGICAKIGERSARQKKSFNHAVVRRWYTVPVARRNQRYGQGKNQHKPMEKGDRVSHDTHVML